MAAFAPVEAKGLEGLRSIANSVGLGRPQVESAVSLLFAAGARPTAAQVRALARSSGNFVLSLDPAEDGEDSGWVELLANGLTYDLTGLAPGPADPTPGTSHRFGLAPQLDLAGMEAIRIVPGPHLSGGMVMFPVVRCLAWLGALLADLPGVVAVAWHPAHSACDPAYFRTSVLRWIEGGVFPGLGLTALVPDACGGLGSEGLTLFTGQELHLSAELVADRAEGAKLALRLLHWLVENGRIDSPVSLAGPNGEPLLLLPQADQPLIKVIKSS